jgi:hypothetical protein
MKFKDLTESSHKCPHCGGPLFNEMMMMEKKDACYYKVKASAKVWPSAYASGRLVQCRKKGAANYGNKSESLAEGADGTQTILSLLKDFVKTREEPEDRKIVAGIYKAFQQGMEQGFTALYNAWEFDIDSDFYYFARNKGVDLHAVADQAGFDTDSIREGINEMNRNQQPVTAHQVYMYMIQQAPDFMKHAPTEDVKKAILKALTFGSQISVEDLASYAYGMLKSKSVDEDYNPEYDDEAGMADNNLETLKRAVEGIDDLIQSGDNLPEWCQEKIAVAKSMLVAVWDYMYSEEASDEVDPEVDEMFEAMQDLVSEMAQKNRVSEDLVWESFEALPDNVLYETAAWRRKEGKSKKGGLNAKGVASYRRENPGSKLQMAVTTKPSKLKPGSKAAKRRKSFCARMSGVKGPMKKPNGKPTRKALALRKWNC